MIVLLLRIRNDCKPRGAEKWYSPSSCTLETSISGEATTIPTWRPVEQTKIVCSKVMDARPVLETIYLYLTADTQPCPDGSAVLVAGSMITQHINKLFFFPYHHPPACLPYLQYPALASSSAHAARITRTQKRTEPNRKRAKSN